MIFKKIITRDFLSFKDFEYEFEMYPIQIQGENLTDDDQESNGSGKSAIQAMVEYALLSSNSRKIKDSELIRFGQEKAEVTLFILCPVREEQLIIKRTQTRKGSQLQLFINTEPVKFANVRDGNNFILSWIGISKEDLTNYFIINKERFVSFFTASNRQKMELINRFSNVSVLDNVDTTIKGEIKKHDEEINELLREQSFVKGELKVICDNIDTLNNQDLEALRSNKIHDTNEQIYVNAESIIDLQEQIKKLNLDYDYLKGEYDIIKGKLDRCGIELRNFKTKNFKKLYAKLDKRMLVVLDDIRSQNKVMGEIRAVEEELNTIINEINKNLLGTIGCPECGHEFLPSNPEHDLECEKEHLGICHQEMEKVVMQLREGQVVMDRLETELQSLQREVELVRKKEMEANKEKAEIKSEYDEYDLDLIANNRRLGEVKQKILETKLEVSGFEAHNVKLYNEIDKLTNEPLDHAQELERLQIQKAEKENKLVDFDVEIKVLDTKISDAKIWIEHFKRFRLYLANKPLKAIESYCNHYLEQMKSDIRIMLKGFKIKADGNLKEEITPYVVRDEIRDFGSFSGGERGRVLFSMILAVQHMINTTNKWGGLNFLSIDEVFEGVDGKGLHNLMKSVKSFVGTILVITHVVDHKVSTNKITIEKVNGLSKIKQV